MPVSVWRPWKYMNTLGVSGLALLQSASVDGATLVGGNTERR